MGFQWECENTKENATNEKNAHKILTSNSEKAKAKGKDDGEVAKEEGKWGTGVEIRIQMTQKNEWIVYACESMKEKKKHTQWYVIQTIRMNRNVSKNET